MASAPMVNCIDQIPEISPLLSIRAISKHFNERAAIHNLSFSIDPGEIIGVFGDPGSGKANIIHLLSGVIAPSSGHIWFDGEDVTHLSAELRARRGIACSAQPGSLFPDLTATENVLIHGVQHHLPLFPRQGGKTYAEEARDLLDAVGLAECADRLVGELSAAQQCQVAMAIGLASKPSLLLVDGTGLSGDKAGAELGRALTRLTDRGAAVLFTSANPSPVVDICDRIVVLHAGVIIARGVPTRFVVEPPVRASYQPYLQ